MTASKYLTPLLQIAITLILALQTAARDGFDARDGVEFVVLVAGVVVTYVVPLTAGRWPGILKIGTSVVFGTAAAILAIIDAGGDVFATDALFTIGLAALNALAAALGVAARLSDVAKAVADPAIDNVTVLRSDPGAYRVITQRAA